MYSLALEILLFWSLTFLLSGHLQSLTALLKGIQHQQRETLDLEWPWNWNDLEAVATCVGILALPWLAGWDLSPSSILGASAFFSGDGVILSAWKGSYSLKCHQCQSQKRLPNVQGPVQNENAGCLVPTLLRNSRWWQQSMKPGLGPVQLRRSRPRSWPWPNAACQLADTR